jgi:hypothetical protein
MLDRALLLVMPMMVAHDETIECSISIKKGVMPVAQKSQCTGSFLF